MTQLYGLAQCGAGDKDIAMHAFETIQSPFARLRALLEGLAPGRPPIDMTIGEPRHGLPDIVAGHLDGAVAGFGKYPPSNGIPQLREAIARWLERRYPVLEGSIDPDRHVLPLNGSREGLFSAIFIATARKGGLTRPAVLMPNPFYQAYYAAALAAGAEPVLLPATQATGHLPDLDAIPTGILNRTVAFYLATPANPQGVVASQAYLERLVGLARHYGFMLFLDECYSEIYRADPPPGGLAAALDPADGFPFVVAFNSLSKRSNAPGLRSGFIAGDAGFIADYARFRNVACPQLPLPVQHVSAALWDEETHVEASRALYASKFALASELLSAAENFFLPGGGFFLWLDANRLGGGEAAAKTFWKDYGVRVLPGAYLAQPDSEGGNPGLRYVRVALVDDIGTTRDALTRIAGLLTEAA